MFPEKLYIREVCPRDGWQKYKTIISTDTKISLIKSMIDYGVKELEIGVFSSVPKLVRQYPDLMDVAAEIVPYAKEKGVILTSLVNDYNDACHSLDAGIDHVGCFVSISETFGKGFGKTIAESFECFKEIAAIPNITVDLNLGAVFGCPFGDITPVERTLDYIEKGLEIGVSSIGLADSAGKSTPFHVQQILETILQHHPADLFSIHLHNTQGFGMANAYTALTCGISHFDTSLGAMGGCPVIPNARGNIATEDFVNMADKLDIPTGIDLSQCIDTSVKMSEQIKNPVISSMAELQVLSK